MRTSSPISLHARALFLATLGAAASGCTAPPVPAPPAPPPAPRAPAPVAPTASTTPDAGEAPPAPAPRELGPREGAPGSTRGTIACGSKRCRAPEEVCAIVEGDLSWACVPSSRTKDLQSAVYWCDDGTDCPWGKTCCRSFASAAEAFVCTTRDFDCSIEVCEEGGARCPPGMACRDRVCQPANIPGAKCGAKRCGGAAPICRWEKGRGECVTGEQAQALMSEVMSGGDHALLRCTRNADCGAGFHCCTGGAMGAAVSFCTLNCDQANTMAYCDTVADCPKMPGLKVSCQKPGIDLPAWSKVCVGESP